MKYFDVEVLEKMQTISIWFKCIANGLQVGDEFSFDRCNECAPSHCCFCIGFNSSDSCCTVFNLVSPSRTSASKTCETCDTFASETCRVESLLGHWESCANDREKWRLRLKNGLEKAAYLLLRVRRSLAGSINSERN